jgi:2-amino-4-hydroxy-6-hydroxymethyldihydropteridine diphosphokinase
MLLYLFPNIVFSDPILSEPEDDNFKYLFRNILACFTTDMNLDELISKIKLTERAVGRTPRDKYQGKVIIDIDILMYGDDVIRPQDLEKEYIQQLLAIFEIPEFVEEEEVEETVETEVVIETQETVETEKNVNTESPDNIETQETIETENNIKSSENIETEESIKAEPSEGSEDSEVSASEDSVENSTE